MIKRIVVLANSRREGLHCIAGKEIFRDSNQKLRIGDWIRPVPLCRDEGLQESVCSVSDVGGLRQVQFGDIIEIDLKGPQPTDFHPENWILEKTTWKLIKHLPKKLYSELIDKPVDLWGRNSFVPCPVGGGTGLGHLSFVGTAETRNCSLMCISVPGHIHLTNEEDERGARQKVGFTFNDFYYTQFSLTDVSWPVTRSEGVGAIQGRNTKELKGPWFITISFGPPYNRNEGGSLCRYKFIAALARG